MSKTIIAIDPGQAGGLAFQPLSGPPLLHSMPATEGDIADLLNSFIQKNGGKLGLIVYLEEVGGFIKGNPAPGSAMFNFGRNFGYILGCCAGLQLPVKLVTPQMWQKGLRLRVAAGLKPTEHKRRLKAEAQRLHPDLTITLKTADALLILDYALRVEGG